MDHIKRNGKWLIIHMRNDRDAIIEIDSIRSMVDFSGYMRIYFKSSTCKSDIFC